MKRKYLEISALADPGHGADEDDGQDDHQGHTRGVCHAPKHAKEAWLGRHQPVHEGVGRSGLGRVEDRQGDVVLAQGVARIGHHVDANVDQVHYGVDDAVDEDEATGDFVEVDVLVQGQDDVHAKLSELCDGMPEHEDKDKHAGKVEALACSRRYEEINERVEGEEMNNDALTTSPSKDDSPISGSVSVFEAPVLVDAAHEESKVDQDEYSGERQKLCVVPHVRHGELMRHSIAGHLTQGVGLFGLGRHQPPVDGDGQVLQEALVLGQLGLEGLEGDAAGQWLLGAGGRGQEMRRLICGYGCGRGRSRILLLLRYSPGQSRGVVKESSGQLVHFSLVKLHAVLVHAGPHDVLQLFLLNQAITLKVERGLVSQIHPCAFDRCKCMTLMTLTFFFLPSLKSSV